MTVLYTGGGETDGRVVVNTCAAFGAPIDFGAAVGAKAMGCSRWGDQHPLTGGAGAVGMRWRASRN
jgi:hypothetical protein